MNKQTLTRMMLFALAILFCLSPYASQSQGTPTIDFTVEVVDYHSLQPIPGPTVCVSADSRQSAPDYQPAFWGKWLTDASGRATVNHIPVAPGMGSNYFYLRVVKQGYKIGGAQVTPNWIASLGPAGVVRILLETSLSQPSLNSPNSDCGTPPTNPLSNMTMTIDPSQEVANAGDIRSFRLWWSMYNFARSWYQYEWQIDDPNVADRTGPQFQSTAFQVKALAPGMATITADLLAPNGFLAFARKASDPATLNVLRTGTTPPPPSEPYTFGWETPINEREMTAFQLPNPCAVGKNLAEIVHARRPPDCSIRTDNGLCAQCHRSGGARPTLENIPKQAFMNEVQNFVTNPNADPNNTGSEKPQNLKNFFQDWINRGFPD